MPFLTPDTLPTEYVCRVLKIPDSAEWLEIVSGALSVLTKEHNFELFGAIDPQTCAEIFTEMFYEYTKGTVCMIGSILPYATTVVPLRALPCDGAEYDRVDYPSLYAILDTAYIVDVDTFRTPDLRGRMVIGVGAGAGLTARVVGDFGGEETHELTVGELPTHDHSSTPHTHTDSGHIHGYSYPTINLDLEAPGVPDIFGAGNPPIPLSTSIGYAALSAETVTVGSTGDGDSHENMQPFHALKYCIIAR